MLKQKTLIGIGLVTLAAVIVAVLWYGPTLNQDRTVAVDTPETISRPDISLAFTFPSGETAFSLIESAATSSEVLAAYVLMPTEDYVAFSERAEAAGETPATVAVLVFSLEGIATTTQTASGTEPLDRMARLQKWATEQDALTSFARALTPPELVEIDGVTAFRYRADGLYQQEIYLASYKSRAYMFVSQFNDEADPTYAAFGDIIRSVQFN